VASTLTKEDVETIQAICSQMLAQRSAPIGRDCVTVSGSYDPKDGTAQAIFGDTYAIIGDDGDSGIAYPRVPIATTQVGDQDGPMGNERCVLIPTQSGFIKLFHHGPDDSPAAPSGQRWFTNRKVFKLVTLGGHTLILDDIAKKVTLQSAGGLSIVLDDNNGVITLGSGDDPGTTDGLTRKTDVQNAINTAISGIMSAVVTWTNLHFQAGSNTATAPTNPTVTVAASTKVEST
jgi:hypothetical protein